MGIVYDWFLRSFSHFGVLSCYCSCTDDGCKQNRKQQDSVIPPDFRGTFAGAHGLGAAHHPPLRWPAGRAHQTGSWCMCIARSRIPCGLVLSTHLLQRSNSWRFRGVQHEGALREACAGHVNSRLNIAKIVTKINTTRSPRPLPARSMYHSAHTSVNCEAQNQRPMHHSAHTSVNSEAHVRGSHASIDDWGRMWQFFWTPAFLTFRHHWSALCNDATVTRRTI